ncbi:hypothetical protein LTR08_004091 [Meristemomyces frigidus]|nr:hypothetical protein LTR08_004091 [Meristemomyces frigidus]
MAAQAAQMHDTIRAMKLALTRNRTRNHPQPASPTSSSSSSPGPRIHSNRNNKLAPPTRSAARLDTTGGAPRYKRKVVHAGYARYVINKRPKLWCDDGDVVDPRDIPSDADDEERALYGEPLHEDPFGGVKLEELLRPLTSAADLPEHPGLSAGFTSQGLTQMVRQAAEMLRRERVGLERVKRLLWRLRGDGGWAALERFETSADELFLLSAEESGEGSAGDTDGGAVTLGEDGDVAVEQSGGRATGEQFRKEDVMEGIDTQDHVETADPQTGNADATQPNGAPPTSIPTATDPNPSPHDPCTTNNPPTTSLPHSTETTTPHLNPPPPHQTTPRPRPRPPPPALSDPDLNLPRAEAEATRKLLMLYVQKQEHVVRQLATLHEGLQRTERLRGSVWAACRSEGHVHSGSKTSFHGGGGAGGAGVGGGDAEMSDGEDWVDLAYWGLGPGSLEKGKDEVEDAAEEEGRRVGGRRRRVVGR